MSSTAIVRTAEYRDSYANNVQVKVSLWDLQLIFGQVRQDEEEAYQIEQFHSVYLSPQQAKAFLQLLQSNVAAYEKTFGEIRMDPIAAVIAELDAPSPIQ